MFPYIASSIGLIGGLVLALLFTYLYRPKYKFLAVVLITALIAGGFFLALYYLYKPFPFAEGLRSYELFKGCLVDLLGLLWGALASILILALLAVVTALINRFGSRSTESFRDSRRTLLKGLAVGIPVLAMGGGIWAAKKGQAEVVVNKETFAYPNLPSALKNYKIAQISDVHIGAFIDMGDFDNIVSKVLAEQPNRLVITGDLIDDVERLPALAKRLEVLAPLIPDGIDYIYGNHEHFRNYNLVKKVLATTPMRILDNAAQLLFDGDQPVYMAGVNYDMKREPAIQKAFLDKAMAQVPEGAFTILLAHHPEFFDLAVERGIPLTLAGHTHGGQIQVADETLVPVGTPYVKGRYEKDGKFCYVNAGSGHWYPVRINCPREITIIEFADV
ncbi:MAG: metallophosphoesterase [Veillonella sp.]|nr:metallophosphoesterase [Veillonella sp.]